MSRFFDEYPLFYETSRTSPLANRLDGRYQAIIATLAHEIRGKRVLDIASHDGRWSFAALAAGASHVIGVEPRTDLVRSANRTFDIYGVDKSRYQFANASIFTMGNDLQQCDVVLCLGYFYHTIRHIELMGIMERTGARLLVVDTEVAPGVSGPSDPLNRDDRLPFQNPSFIQLLADPIDHESMAVEEADSRSGYTLAGRPSSAAVRLMADHFMFDIDQFDWQTFFASHPESAAAMQDYREGWRKTFYLRRRQMTFADVRAAG